MGVVTISSSSSRTSLGYTSSFSTSQSSIKKPFIVAFKSSKSDNTAVATRPQGSKNPLENGKTRQKKRKNATTRSRKAALVDEVPLDALELDYADAAAKLESIFKLDPATETVVEDDGVAKDLMNGKKVVRSRRKGLRRLSLDKRMNLKRDKVGEAASSVQKMKNDGDEEENIQRLVRDYSASTDLVSLDWKKMKIPPVLPSSEHTWLFKLMQPMKDIVEVKDTLQKDLEREPNEAELADAVKMSVAELRKKLEIGHAARNKLIKHNLRLVLFVINKYFQDFANSPKFQDLCQAGVKGLITAIDRFEPNRRFRLSTYGLFWIRHAIIRSMTVSSFTRVSFGLESVRLEIQRAKLELMYELERIPTEEEIIKKAGISPERYREVMRASRPVYSLNSRHMVTQEEFIDGIADVDGVSGDNRRQPALLRLALDDVLDSLKPKESLVIRQRFGLDGKGDRTLSEIAGNLSISREMVRKHEVKALMKLKHPTRVEYLQRHVV